MVALALVIVFVTLQDLAMGMVRPLVSDAPYVHWRQTPVLFLLESALWLLLALLLGWAGLGWAGPGRAGCCARALGRPMGP